MPLPQKLRKGMADEEENDEREEKEDEKEEKEEEEKEESKEEEDFVPQMKKSRKRIFCALSRVP